MNVVLYTTNCPRCNVLVTKLNDKGIPFTEFTDVDEMINKGISLAPMLEVDGEMMDFATANNWIKNYNK